MMSMPKRPRRNRATESIRSLVRESSLSTYNLIMPLFVMEGIKQKVEVPSLPGIHRYSADLIVEECQHLITLGISGIVLFPVLSNSLKDKQATESWNDQGLYQNTIRAIKKGTPALTIFTDVAMDPYSSDGHDGLLGDDGQILNDETLPLLAKMALSQAKAGADIIAPSDMMDGRVGYLRKALDDQGFTQVGILSYSAKYASSFYGPFRDALESAPKSRDKKTYQMDPANVREAIREVKLDIAEGADMVMVKPGLAYMDVLRAVREHSDVPVAVYNVSGEYAMVHAAAASGSVNYQDAVMEILLGFKRAGADLIFTYHAKEAAQWLRH